MWLPVVVPYVYQPYSNMYETRSRAACAYPTISRNVNRAVNETVVSLNVVHAGSQGCQSPHPDDGRRFMLNRSLFDLIWNNHCLELTDPKLLGWYLSLSAVDRTIVQQEGGLNQFIHRHPALEVVENFVYLKEQFRENCSAQSMTMSTKHQNKSRHPVASQCQNCGRYIQFGTKRCYQCGIHVVISDDKVCKSENDKEIELLPRNLREELGTVTTKNKISPQKYVSPDEEESNAQAQCLSQLWEEVKQEQNIRDFNDPRAQGNLSLDMELEMRAQKINRIQTNEDSEVTADYYSFNSTSLNHTELSYEDQNTEASFNDSIVAMKGSTQSSASHEDSQFYCLSNSFEVSNDSGQHVGDQKQMGSSHKSTSSVQCQTASFTSTQPTTVCETLQAQAIYSVATDTDSLPVSNKKDIQIMQKSRSDKNTVTEVYMADLDVLTEEFIKLKQMEKELKQLKGRKSRTNFGSSHCGNGGGCDCAQRVRRAELRLLGLQFVMCQQHCWRRYFTSPLGESAYQGIKALPDTLTETLDALEKDYNEMKRQILAGTPLDDLKPLSVDSQKILTTGTCYSPSSVLDAHFGPFDCLESTNKNSNEKAEGMRGPLCQNMEDIPDEPKGNSNRTAGLFNKQPGNFSAIKDLNGSEAWFDAEEELMSPNQDGNLEKKKEEMEVKNAKQKETDEKTLLFVTCLPNNVTEKEMLIWLEKYNVTDVHITTFNNDVRAAIVYLKSPEDATAAVKNLNGCTLQGHTVYVQQQYGSTLTYPKLNGQPHSQAKSTKPEVGRPKTIGILNSLSTRGPRCSVDRLTKVCDSPTASGTCVPQRCVGNGSFNTIMTRLSERHPDIDRQKIVDALLELREINQGMLSGFCLSTIVDMTSQHLTKGFSSKRV